MVERDKINYYLDMAKTVLERATCLRRKFGAIIVKNNETIQPAMERQEDVWCSDLGSA